MKILYDNTSIECSKLITKKYSTSFSIGIRFLGKKLRNPIYSTYGFVRLADEIVDTFHEFDKEQLLKEFRQQTYEAIDRKISTNPVLNSFQQVVYEYRIPMNLIDTFLDSMEMDLKKDSYNEAQYKKYILGSAEVVGLMCLKIFVNGDESEYKRLEYYAMKLGSAFQKINFLRDLKDDYHGLGRVYFPGIDMSQFTNEVKKEIEQDIEFDFAEGFKGIKELPKESRFGVYIAYVYYYRLFVKIKNMPAKQILNNRVRIHDAKKYELFVTSYLRHSLNIL